MKSWVFLSILLLAPVASVAGCIELIEFRIEDQFQQEHTEQELLGAPVLLTWADRKGNEYTDAWALALGEAFEGREIEHRAIAHVEGVPGWIPGLKGRIRGSFSEDPERWALLDWEGRFAAAYHPTEDQVTVFVFDAEGCLRARVSGRDPEPALIEAVLEAFPVD